jgi:hypothetical protein
VHAGVARVNRGGADKLGAWLLELQDLLCAQSETCGGPCVGLRVAMVGQG